MRRKARKDDNHQQIVDALRRVGAVVFDVSSTPCGFDLVVVHRGVVYVVEIKDGNKLPQKFKGLAPHEQWDYLVEKMLTDNERKALDDMKYVNGQYNIIYNTDTALEVIGAGWKNKAR